jgi:uncharacterized protein (UPF0548 family)
MWSVRRPSAAKLDALLATVAKLPLSYPEVGMSRGAAALPGYGCEHHRVELALGFEAAREAVSAFATHRLAYLFVYPPDARVEANRDVLVCARVGPMWTTNPCRIVYVDDTPDRFAYAYGTLPGHSEHGEEVFTVERTPGGVVAETIAYARPQDLLARLGKPVAHRFQARVKRDYMAALVATASTAGP